MSALALQTSVVVSVFSSITHHSKIHEAPVYSVKSINAAILDAVAVAAAVVDVVFEDVVFEDVVLEVVLRGNIEFHSEETELARADRSAAAA